jgi:hypothetical protein
VTALAAMLASRAASSASSSDNLVFGLSTAEVAAIAAVIALALTLTQIAVSVLTERRRTQPIVIAHERTPRTYNQQRQRWVALARVANEAENTAFNVRFGVSYFGVRFAYRLHEADPLSGNRHRVLKPMESFTAAIEVTSQDLWGGKARPEDSVYYWARYQNASGATWETRNPPDRGSDLAIRRVFVVRVREWIEKRKRQKLTRESEVVMRQVHDELVELRERGRDEAADSDDA